MKKLALRMDDLRVESFDPLPYAGAPERTVDGYQAIGSGAKQPPSCDGSCESCPVTCPVGCTETCGETCGRTCETCPRTCPETCERPTGNPCAC